MIASMRAQPPEGGAISVKRSLTVPSMVLKRHFARPAFPSGEKVQKTAPAVFPSFLVCVVSYQGSGASRSLLRGRIGRVLCPPIPETKAMVRPFVSRSVLPVATTTGWSRKTEIKCVRA